MWGLSWNLPGTDLGFVFKIQLKIESPPAQPVGPNKVLPEQGPLAPAPLLPPKEIQTPSKATTPSPVMGLYSTPLTPSSTGQRLLNLIQGAFQVLNG